MISHIIYYVGFALLNFSREAKFLIAVGSHAVIIQFGGLCLRVTVIVNLGARVRVDFRDQHSLWS